MRLKKRSPESGSAPLELVAATLLIALPLPIGIELHHAQSNQLLAETIARHALRGALLRGQSIAEYQVISRQISNEIQLSWRNPKKVSLHLECTSPCRKGSFLSLWVEIDSAKAVQTQVVDR